jgi:hypothetical protein
MPEEVSNRSRRSIFNFKFQISDSKIKNNPKAQVLEFGIWNFD